MQVPGLCDPAPATNDPAAHVVQATARSTSCVLILSRYAILTVRRSRLVARTKLADSTRNAKRSTRRISILARCARLARAQANLISKLAFSARQARTARARLAQRALHTLAFATQSTQTPCVPVRAHLALYTTRHAKRGAVLPVRTSQAVRRLGTGTRVASFTKCAHTDCVQLVDRSPAGTDQQRRKST